MLYTRDYNLLTESEQTKLEEAEEYKRNNLGKLGETSPEVLSKYHSLKPAASYHYESLFPNNFLRTNSLNEKAELLKIETEFVKLLEDNITERDILNFINKNRYFNLIASLFHSGYTFGHHDAYLFKEFELPSTHKAIT